MVDARQGLLPLDCRIGSAAAATGKPLALAVKKADSDRQEALGSEFHRLGITDIFLISAEHGRGVDDLLDCVTAAFGVASRAVRCRRRRAGRRGEDTEALIQVAIIGRPNVGKSPFSTGCSMKSAPS